MLLAMYLLRNRRLRKVSLLKFQFQFCNLWCITCSFRVPYSYQIWTFVILLPRMQLTQVLSQHHCFFINTLLPAWPSIWRLLFLLFSKDGTFKYSLSRWMEFKLQFKILYAPYQKKLYLSTRKEMFTKYTFEAFCCTASCSVFHKYASRRQGSSMKREKDRPYIDHSSFEG